MAMDRNAIGHNRFSLSAVFASLYEYLYCMIASTVLVKQPVLGGALYMTVQVTQMAVRQMQPAIIRQLPRNHRISALLFTGISALIALTLLLIFPRTVDMPLLWLLFSLVFLISLLAWLRKLLLSYCRKRQLRSVQKKLRYVELHVLFLVLPALILFVSLPADTAWYLLGGFALCTVLSGYTYSSGQVETQKKAKRADVSPRDFDRLSSISALKTYHTVSTITMTALQVTLIMIYTFIAVTANDLLICMGIAFVFTYLASRLTHAFIGRPSNRRRDPANLMILGLIIWLFSLTFFSLHLLRLGTLWPFAAIAACTAGTTITATALDALDADMDDVAAFALSSQHNDKLGYMRMLLTKFATMIGQMIALIGLSAILFYAENTGRGMLELTLRPALLLPAAALVTAALPAALRFPLSSRYSQKLHTFLMLKENGETNIPLQRQLEDTLVKVSRRHYGIKVLMFLLKPVFYSRVVGKESVEINEDVSAVFICNHGELYGPIVTNLFIPFSFRPWVISDMAEANEIAQYIYRYTIKRQKWLPESWKKPVSRLAAPILAWIMESIECIPVYRNKPRKLINTFRETAAAMEAGGNILLFPENPNDPKKDTKGYLRDGVGEFFTGFVMIAQLYYQRTQKCAQFIPVYADKKNRTLTFGVSVHYNPNNHPTEEKLRIVNHLRGELLRMGGYTADSQASSPQPTNR